MERLIFHVHQEIAREFKLALIGPSGCHEYASAADFVHGCALSPLGWFLLQIQYRTIAVARKFRPNLIVSGSGITAPAALFAARSIDVPVVCFLHGLDIIAANRFYQCVFLPAIRRCDVLLVNSRNTKRLAVDAGISAPKIRVLHPGVLPSTRLAKRDTDKFRENIGVGQKTRILLSVGRLMARKGLVEFIGRVLPGLVAVDADVVLVILGDEPRHSLKKTSNQLHKINAAAAASKVAGHVKVMGHATEEMLSQAYAASDLLIFPVLDLADDVEGFGMVAIEAAARGLPTVAFAVGGVPDAVKEDVSGYLIPPGNYAEFKDAIIRYLRYEDPMHWRRRCKRHARCFSWDRFGTRLRGICNEITEIPCNGGTKARG